MTKVISCSSLCGRINAIPSKSAAHRLLICAALADLPTVIDCPQTSDDIEVTARCLTALGAKIEYKDGAYAVTPIKTVNRNAVLDCGESGSTLRFLLPVVCALGGGADFVMRGRLPKRPLQPLTEELEAHGAVITRKSNDVISVSGQLCGDDYSVAADISSQFVSGLLFMLSLCGGRLRLEGEVQSAGYVEMTCRALSSFSAEVLQAGNVIDVKKTCPLHSQSHIVTEGDWSNAAFFIVAGVIGKSAVTVDGLDFDSAQGDRAIVDILRSMGAKIDCGNGSVTAYPSLLASCDIDASQIPDIVPVLAVAAAAAKGVSRIFGAERLRLKESDRLASTAKMLCALGADVSVTDDSLIINGGALLSAGAVSSCGDHRIAMSAAVACIVCSGSVTIDGAEAVNKSYPGFWEDFGRLSE